MAEKKTNICLDCGCACTRRCMRCRACSYPHTRKHPTKKQLLEEGQATLCACGCGQILKKRKDGRQYNHVRGHKKTHEAIDTQCDQCGKAIKIKKWRKDTYGSVFCSHECAAKHRKQSSRVELICFGCNKPFKTKPSRKQGKKTFCSETCKIRYVKQNGTSALRQPTTSKTVQCDSCGNPLKVFLSKYKVNKRFYCSVECRAKHIIGQNNPSYTSGQGRRVEYGFNWKQQRRKALERDNHTCQHCRKRPTKPRYLHVHHVTPAYKFDGDWLSANDLLNLLTLCLPCHKQAESGKIVLRLKLI